MATAAQHTQWTMASDDRERERTQRSRLQIANATTTITTKTEEQYSNVASGCIPVFFFVSLSFVYSPFLSVRIYSPILFRSEIRATTGQATQTA